MRWHGKPARDLVERQAQASKADQIGRRYAHIRIKSEQRHQPLAPTFVDHTQDRCRNHRRMSLERTLDLLRMHILAGCDDHAAGTAGEPQEAAIVEHADVAHRHRVAMTWQQRFASAGILHEEERTCYKHLASLSGRETLSEMVADSQTDVCERTPDRVRWEILIVLRYGHEAQLRGAVELGKTRRWELLPQFDPCASLPFGTGR